MDAGLQIRARVADDLGALVEMAREVREHDRYPIYEPDEGLALFLTRPEPLGAWVACNANDIVGHVVLQPSATATAMRIASAHRADPAPAYVSRLLVDPDWRGRGVGVRLLDHVRRAAVAMGRSPFLEAIDIPEGAPAIDLYRACGWQEIGRAPFDLLDDGTEELIFAGSLD